MFKTEIDAKAFIATLSDLERKQLPYGTMLALNDTMFDVRTAWQRQMARVFDRPVPFTLNAVLYKKATRQNLVAEVFIRDEAGKGTPPSKYLQPEAEGGARRMKSSERKLGRYYVPGAGYRGQLDQYGNIPAGVVAQILSQLGLSEHVAGFMANQTETSRGRRLRRAKKKGIRGGEFFLIRSARGRLRPGVYERIRTGFGTTVRSVLFFVNAAPQYTVRFDATKFARDVFYARFPTNFINRMSQAILTARH